ncbi:MAG TPA: TetR/AcrR family transcriptional regulator [Solirubrobacteraceae bacterium]|nr:TetR/AcrR family transcriptional regulator [Solirubrobacteraceae bacterium]
MGTSSASRLQSPAYRVASERILDAATAVFAAEGFDRANMDAIAARAGVTKPTLYARFGSKEGLFQAAVEREYELRKARLFDAYGGGEAEPFRQRLHRWSGAYFDLVRDRPDAFVLIAEGERHPVAAAVIKRANDEIVDRIAELVVEVSGHRAPHGARLIAVMISGIFTACAREAVATRIDIAHAAALCESFLHSALRGLDPTLIDAVG